jgi:hypothetical protein
LQFFSSPFSVAALSKTFMSVTAICKTDKIKDPKARDPA